jgi:hypothetical protein
MLSFKASIPSQDWKNVELTLEYADDSDGTYWFLHTQSNDGVRSWAEGETFPTLVAALPSTLEYLSKYQQADLVIHAMLYWQDVA